MAGGRGDETQDRVSGGRSNPRTAVTLDDVARIAGVSTATVSRTLNHPERVAGKTREKIDDAIARIGYVPNLLAGGLASRRSRLIAAIVYSMENVVHAETVKYFSRHLRQNGYQVLLGETEYREDLEETLVAAVLCRRPDGILLTGSKHTAACRRMLLAADIPIVETWELTPTPLDVAIGFSYEEVGRTIAGYLLGKGYREIAVISAGDERSKTRVRAFREAVRRETGHESPWIRIPTPSSFQLGREALGRLLDTGFREGAIFCSSDNLAHGVLTEAAARGLSVPRPIAVMGFGDQPYAAYTHPALTTVRFDREWIGNKAAEILLARIRGEQVPETILNVDTVIIERETT